MHAISRVKTLEGARDDALGLEALACVARWFARPHTGARQRRHSLARRLIYSMLTTVANDAASTQQHVASAPLKRLANGLRCADAMRFDAVKIEVALPSWLLRLDAAKEKGKKKEHASLSTLPRGARCHQLLSDRGVWRCWRRMSMYLRRSGRLSSHSERRGVQQHGSTHAHLLLPPPTFPSTLTGESSQTRTR